MDCFLLIISIISINVTFLEGYSVIVRRVIHHINSFPICESKGDSFRVLHCKEVRRSVSCDCKMFDGGH